MNFETALAIATSAHFGQFDKAGNPYIDHPIAVAASLDNDFEKAIAVLHDVVEDCNVTMDDLIALGLSEEQAKILDLLTHKKDVGYFDYINLIKQYSKINQNC